MDNLQYLTENRDYIGISGSFKPYYKWIIFNILSSNKNIDFILV